MMTKCDIIELAGFIRSHNITTPYNKDIFTLPQIKTIASFCKHQNPNFDTQGFINYIDGKCDQIGEVY